MIEKLTLENFQAHANTTLEFDKGVNIILGASDQGKSSIIRAIRWVVENRPTGIAFRRYGTDKVSATMVINGNTICRTKTDTLNSYSINGKGRKALRADVPPDVAQAINFGIANIQTQHEQYFLLQSSAGEAAKTINRIANLEIVAETVKSANSYVNALNGKLELTRQLLEKTEADIVRLDWVPPAVSQLETLENAIAAHEARNQRIAKLVSLIEEAQVYKLTIERNRTASVGLKLAHVKKIYAAMSEAKLRYNKLQELVQGCRQFARTCERVCDIDMARSHILISRYQRTKDKIDSLVTHITNAQTAQAEVMEACTLYNEARRGQRRLEQDVPRCPTCGQYLQRSTM